MIENGQKWQMGFGQVSCLEESLLRENGCSGSPMQKVNRKIQRSCMVENRYSHAEGIDFGGIF